MKKLTLITLAVLFGIILHAETYVYRTPGLVEGVVTGVGAVGLGVLEFGKGLVCGSTTTVNVTNTPLPARQIVVQPAVTAVTPAYVTTPLPIAPVITPCVSTPVVVTAPCYSYPGYGHAGRYYYNYRPYHYYHPCYRRPYCW